LEEVGELLELWRIVPAIAIIFVMVGGSITLVALRIAGGLPFAKLPP
jgi:hypothetical protein